MEAEIDIQVETQIEVAFDETVKGNKLFEACTQIILKKPELFKYAIFMWEVPMHVKESDFDYLQNKVPALEMLLEDHILFTDKGIANLSNDDRVKKIASEAIGVGLGLKYTIEILKTNPNRFKKIPPASEGKYLDYSITVDSKEYEIETKGTVSRYYSSMKNDIISKKKNAAGKKVYQKFGTIALISNAVDMENSKCVIVDDPADENNTSENDIYETQLLNYAILFSYILDSKYYNKYINPLLKKRVTKTKINSDKFYARYSFNNKMYYGECFDYRLIRESFIQDLDSSNKLNETFSEITRRVGKTKFFIGIEEVVVNAINTFDKEFLRSYTSEEILRTSTDLIQFLDKDGILIVKASNDSDKQINEIFPEKEVMNRLGLYTRYLKDDAHLCGAPCRSRDIQGKPCAKYTFREYCYFHR